MKRFFVLCILCLACVGLFLPVIASIHKGNEKTDSIVLKGNLEGKGPIRSQTMQSPVVAYQNSTCIQLVFLDDLGKLTISVDDQTGYNIYLTTVNATDGSTLSIDTSSWESGVYTLLITDGLGGFLEGVFEIE